MTPREHNIRELERREFDVLIVGGGINGAVSAAALAAQGASVALIDAGDFASGSSQESSNLAWGGFKYLETGEIGLVRKLCASRNRLIRAYPSSVQEIRFFVSIEDGFRWNRLFIYLSAVFYWMIGGCFTRAPRLLSARDIATEEPIVAPLGPGGVEYSDAFFVDSDARFTFGFVRRAMDRDAVAVNYMRSLGGKRIDGFWHTRARDEIAGSERVIRSRVLINATGPHVDDHNALTQEATAHRHVFSKGVHLIVPQVMASHRVLTFFADDGRLFFVIPLGSVSCIGTTDTRVTTLPTIVTSMDRQFILDNINRRLRLPKPLCERDIIAERCGVRPLAVQSNTITDGRDFVALSRKHAVEVDVGNRHISIFGGKLTDCLNVGDEIVAAARPLGIEIPKESHRWYGEPEESARAAFFDRAKSIELDALTSKLSTEPLSARLWRRYGGTAFTLLDEIQRDPHMADVVIEGADYLRCELGYAARREMIVKLEDFLRRRGNLALTMRNGDIRKTAGLLEACQILFGEQAQEKLDEYFSASPVALQSNSSAGQSQATSRRA